MPQWVFESSRRLSCPDVAHLASLSPPRATCIVAGGGGVPEGAPPNPVATGEGAATMDIHIGLDAVLPGASVCALGADGGLGCLRFVISGGAHSRSPKMSTCHLPPNRRVRARLQDGRPVPGQTEAPFPARPPRLPSPVPACRCQVHASSAWFRQIPLLTSGAPITEDALK